MTLKKDYVKHIFDIFLIFFLADMFIEKMYYCLFIDMSVPLKL